MRQITGTLLLPDGEPATGSLQFVAIGTSLSGVPHSAVATAELAEGVYDVELEAGVYRISHLRGTQVIPLGDATVTDGAAMNLPELLQVDDVPESLAQELLDRVEALEEVPPGSGIAGIDNYPGDDSIEIDAATNPLRPRIRANLEVAGVTSVNGETGAVTLSAADVGADPAGSAATATSTAAAALTDHEAASNPHPGYLTPAEGNAAYDAIGAAATVAGSLTTHASLTTAAHGGIVASTDPRLTDARTPTAHAASHATGQADAISPASIGAATSASVTTVAGDLTTHASDTTSVHGIADTSELVASSTLSRVEVVTEYPDPEVSGVLYVLVP